MSKVIALIGVTIGGTVLAGTVGPLIGVSGGLASYGMAAAGRAVGGAVGGCITGRCRRWHSQLLHFKWYHI